MTSLPDLLRVPRTGEPFSLATVEPRSTRGTDLDEDEVKAQIEQGIGDELAEGCARRLAADGATAWVGLDARTHAR